jgi:hypothetical protein
MANNTRHSYVEYEEDMMRLFLTIANNTFRERRYFPIMHFRNVNNINRMNRNNESHRYDENNNNS